MDDDRRLDMCMIPCTVWGTTLDALHDLSIVKGVSLHTIAAQVLDRVVELGMLGELTDTHGHQS